MIVYVPIESSSWGLAKELGIEASNLPEFEAIYGNAYYKSIDEALLVACGDIVQSLAVKFKDRANTGTTIGQWARHMKSFIYA